MAPKAYAALLRGINVGRHRKVPMAELRTLLAGLGHGAVRTYLQSGNAVFTAAAGSDEETLAAGLRDALAERFGFTVDVLVCDHAYLKAVAAACPFPAADLEPKQLHVLYCSARPDPSRFAHLEAAKSRYHPEEFRLGDRALYLYAPEGLGRSDLGAALSRVTPAEGAFATGRNWNTVVKLVEMTAS
ncbi:DUF1697 domain-containing protein [Streptomyces sp. AV19]|uniref:DUF1697 domain-containing protein n=1 Tax=Streptomyces sp. AV19 TaxID=2793068 RepID=UPI0018FF0CB9|nr:DUF1697 domain-containing protein [Streptomyces sp. AV19]MBH1935279.1 DUF1697 domain-containing protein [Streptomyces sp. AV19]MDG4531166.1 DUF1697 domain-containing protein [Streptomyces sp. AV19]